MTNNIIYFKRKVAGEETASLVLNIPKEIVSALDIKKGEIMDCYITDVEGEPNIFYRRSKTNLPEATNEQKEVEEVKKEIDTSGYAIDNEQTE